ncbi:hypothetical protein G3O06_37930 [Burkholderia sp. Ac-20345]|uniref:hypothetical protein n=1 Tax=Burkholderia sp. Ac-20345 TaxID=2703891 RepID=UPI00197B766F|nr:hypothetical protein [Burkholderia sp. Ac-20345]MBN3783259.1 hypothetical protein [Burkholderia sp. Ac-20345]
MAASEVAMAASEVATVVAQAPASWLTPALLGGILGAAITAGATLWSQHANRQHEKAKLAEQRAYEQAKLAEERERAQHVALRPLEALAQHADEVLSSIEEAFEDYGTAEEAVFRNLKAVHLRFELPSQSILGALPRPLVDQLYEFERALAVSADWLDKQEVRFDVFDTWKLEVQRVVHFGLLACDLANRIRRDLDLAESVYVNAWQRHFEAAFAKVQREYAHDPAEYLLMPEIEARLTPLSQPIAER